VELSNILLLVLLLFFGLVLFGWILLGQLKACLREGREEPTLALMQQQIGELRTQFGQVMDSNARSIQQQLGQMLNHVNERLKENAEVLNQTQQSLGERLDNAARVVGNVQRSLGSLEEANRRIYEVGKDIASLQEILRAPKLRGGLGEFLLEDLLAQILPAEHYSVQHRFQSGEKVDAVIRLGPSLVPVDAKFPLENFKRILEAANDEEKSRAKKQFTADVKKHIDAIAARYIVPDEGTYDFALMYIPAENIYYETIIRDDSPDEKSLSHYAMSQHVMPVSPNSFYVYLQAILLGLKGMKIEDRAREIIQYLGRLQGDFARFREEFTLLGKHVGHAQASYQNADRRLEQFGQKLLVADGETRESCEPLLAGRQG
jgi:DNA recombination protein RmuC